MDILTAKTACRAPFEGVPFLLASNRNKSLLLRQGFGGQEHPASAAEPLYASKPLFLIKACFSTSEIFLSSRKSIPFLFFYRRKSGVPDEFCLSRLSDC
jgi:hypothetical protein